VHPNLSAAVGALEAVRGVSWSVCVRETPHGRVLAELDSQAVLPTASVGKLLLLVEVARQLCAGHLDAAELLRRTPEDDVEDSGLWQHLGADTLRVDDLCVLVGSVSDNLATNVLLRRVGLPAVAALTASLGLRSTALHDRVRDVRGAADPPTLSSGCADELSRFLHQLAVGEVVTAEVSARVLHWLAGGTDLSMVAAALGLDPLAHAAPDRGLLLRHKTGTNDRTRADVGVLSGPSRAVSYAVLAGWHQSADDPRDDVLAGMRELGASLRTHVLAGA
jgi:beta-lactamase class A